MLKGLHIFKRKDGDAILPSVISSKTISAAYDRRKSEIDSLRLYDRGEKQIYAPDISTLVRGVR